MVGIYGSMFEFFLVHEISMSQNKMIRIFLFAYFELEADMFTYLKHAQKWTSHWAIDLIHLSAQTNGHH